MLARTASGVRYLNRLRATPAAVSVTTTMTMTLRMNSTAGSGQSPSTYQFQKDLPHLPVPTLEETATKYLRSVKAVASPEQYTNTEKAVKEFLAPNGAGSKLQEKLLARAKSTDNWISEWWNESAYMAYRDPVVPYVSYFYSYKDDRLRKNPASRAACIVTGALSFKQQLDSQTLVPEVMKKQPLCMDLYKYMFNVCRIPKPNCDDTAMYDSKAPENQYFIAMRKNRFFKIPYVDRDGKQLTTSEIELELLKIYDSVKEPGVAIGALTSENRDVWAKARDNLIAADARNKGALEVIEKAAFVVCLDEGNPVTREERAHQYWHGDGQNRFYDKPLQFIICDSGAAGFMGEHSMMDGTQTHRINDYINDVIFNNKIEFTSGVSNNQRIPREVTFTVNDQVQKDVDQAVADFHKVIGEHELSVFAYNGYGKGLIKKFKCSPDAYMQMILQLAYFKYQGVNRPTYESAATRRFLLGRTETCRSVSLESVDFCNKMESASASVEDKVTAARKAMDAHVKYIADASAAKGCDRHLFGLKKLVGSNEDVPAIFKDPMYSYSSSWYLSTSQLSSEFFNGYGWSQVIDGGFGLAYMINENSLQVNIVSKKLGSEKMRHYLEEAADDMRALFSTELENKPKL